MNYDNRNFFSGECVGLSIQNIKHFLDGLSKALDIYSNKNENICIVGEFNATLQDSALILWKNMFLKTLLSH